VHRGLSAPRIGIVKARQIVMHKAGAMDQLKRRRRRIGDLRAIIAAGPRHGHKDGVPDPRAARQHGMIQRPAQPCRSLAMRRRPHTQRKGRRDSRLDPHVHPGIQTHDGPFRILISISLALTAQSVN
jgi:hypothetical protein